ncbi:MAG: DUF3095 family protein [Pedobacter sp.]
MESISDHFYNHLKDSKASLAEMMLQKNLFKEVPGDWHVIITDIKSSTKAVANGLHETVNFIATGSIVAVLNLAYKANITVPFFFGGDGATFIVPDSILQAAMQALQLYSTNTLERVGLELRAGTVSVKQIYEKGHKLLLSKTKISATLSIPILLGNGLAYAESVIKDEDYLFQCDKDEDGEPDLNGMQCRWDKISPPKKDNEVVSILIMAAEGVEQTDAFRKVFLKMDEIYGVPKLRQPISVSKLKLNTSLSRLGVEMKTRIGNIPTWEFLKTWVTNLYGYLYFRTSKGRRYLRKLVEMSDTLVIDGRINTVISGTEAQRLKLKTALDSLENDGIIWYGIFVSPSAVMSCYVRDLEDGHIHFVDGSEGGYTHAAGILKHKLKNL